MNSRIYKTAALLIVLGAILTLSYERKSLPTNGRTEAQGLPGAPASEMPQPVPRAVAVPESSVTSPNVALAKTHNLVTELASAKDWRVFALSARSRPGEGGYFYAMYVSNLCSRGIVNMPELNRDTIDRAVRNTGTVTSTLLAMIDSFSARCASFAPGEASDLYSNIKQASNDNRDPIIMAIDHLSMALKLRDREMAKASLRELLEIGDPLPLYKDAMLLRVLRLNSNTNTTDEIWLDGKAYSSSNVEELSVLTLALDAAACGGKALCEVDEYMMLGCIGGQYCTSSREDYLRHKFISQGGMTEKNFSRSIALSSRIQEVISTRRVDSLIR